MPKVVSGARIAARGALILVFVGVAEAALGALFYYLASTIATEQTAFTLTAYGLWALAAIFVVVGVVWRRRSKRKLRLLRNGKVARARIVEVDQTSVQINGSPLIRIRLLVEPPGRPPFEATVKEVLPQFLQSRLNADTVTVRYDPDDTGRVVVDWGSAVPDVAPDVTLPGFTRDGEALQPRPRHVPWAEPESPPHRSAFPERPPR